MGYNLKPGKVRSELPPIEGKTPKVANKKMGDATGPSEAIKKSPFARMAGEEKTAKKEETAEKEEGKVKTAWKTPKEVLESVGVAIKKTFDSANNYALTGSTSDVVGAAVVIASGLGALPPAVSIPAVVLGLGLIVGGTSVILCGEGKSSGAHEIEDKIAHKALENARLGEEKSTWKSVEGVLTDILDATKKTYHSGRNRLAGGAATVGAGIVSLAMVVGGALPTYATEAVITAVAVAMAAAYIVSAHSLGKLLAARNVRDRLEEDKLEQKILDWANKANP